MESSLAFVIAIIVLALIFDFINGFHDAANSIATIVSTRVLSPKWAVIWAAFFNFVAFLFFKNHVASTIGKGTIDPTVVDASLIFAALVGAIVWNLLTWYFGLPSSSSHALVGGLVGAALVRGGTEALHWGGIGKICAYIIVAPLMGMFFGMLLMYLTSVTFFKSRPRKLDAAFRKLQLLSASLYSLGHGGNDAQKTMGIITALLYSQNMLKGNFHIPLWVVLACHVAMGLGTLAGGWRIVETMGMKITKLRPVGGFCAETAGAITLFLATSQGIPVSTTHTITGSIVGVGSVNSISTVRWGIAARIIWAWILTIPASAAVSALLTYLLPS